MTFPSRQRSTTLCDILRFLPCLLVAISLNSRHVVSGLSALPFVRHHHILQNYYLNVATDRGSALYVSNAELPRINGAANGSIIPIPSINVTDGHDDDELPLAPPLTFDKFTKMQEKRVTVTIRYTGDSDLRPYFLTVAKKLKASHPDVVLERRILPAVEGDEKTFEVLVDSKVVVGKGRSRKQRGRVDMTREQQSIFVSMQELDVAIMRARRKRRPSTMYGDEGSGTTRLETLRKSKGKRN